MSQGTTVRMWRRSLVVLVALVVVGFGIIVARLVQLQLIQGEDLQKRAVDQQLADTTINAQRGTIYDCNMRPLAQSATVWTVVLEPAYLDDSNRATVVKGLAQILDLDEAELMEKAQNTKSYYTIIKRRIESDAKEKIVAFKEEQEIGNGIRLIEDYKRYYPYGDFAAAALGFTGNDSQGLAGLEQEYDTELTGVPGRLVTARNARGTDMPYDYEQLVPAQNGYSLVLTLDEVIQHYMEKYLEQGIQDNLVQNRGVAVMMDVNTGAILGMAVKEDYDPNKPFELVDRTKAAEILTLPEDQQQQATSDALGLQWKNKAVSDNYEPGSVFKIITSAMALEEGAVTVDTPFYCGGSIKVEGYPRPISCHVSSGHGAETFAQGLWNSCNPVFATVGMSLGTDLFSQYYFAFGFHQKTGVDLPGEGNGQYYNVDNMTNVDLAISSFGQGHTDTPMQVLSAVCAVVNGGKLVQPHIVSQIIDADGNIIKSVGTEVKRQVISEETSKIMCDLLQQNAVSGSGKNGYISGYRIGGKTGTSEKIAEQNATGGEKNYISSYCGFAPADDPKVALLVFYDTPKGDSYYGSFVAAPTFRSIMNEALPYLGVEKKYSEEELAKLDDVDTPNVVGETLEKAKSTITQSELKYNILGNGDTVIAQIPAEGKKIPKSGTVVLYTDTDSQKQTVTVPNLLKMTMSEANEAAQNAGINLKMTGIELSGSVVVGSQSIAEGQEVEPGTIIEIAFISNTSD